MPRDLPISNGNLMINFDHDYNIRDVYWPHVGQDNQTVGDVSFEDREWNGVFEPFRDPSVFADVYVDRQFGTLAWPNGLDMAPEPLYDEARRNPIAEPLTQR